MRKLEKSLEDVPLWRPIKSVKKSAWTKEEVATVREWVKENGNKW